MSTDPIRRTLRAATAFAAIAAACGCSATPDKDRIEERTRRLFGGPIQADTPPWETTSENASSYPTSSRSASNPTSSRSTASGPTSTSPTAQSTSAPSSRSRPTWTTRPDPDADLRLVDCLRWGLQHNAGLRSHYHRWRAALERIPQVTSLPDPVFSFAHFVEQIETRTGPQNRRYSLSQTLPWFGKLRVAGEVATHAAEEAWHGLVAERLRIERDIEVAYYEYAYLAKAIETTRGALELLKGFEPVVQTRIAGGASSQADLLRLQVEIGRIENDLESLERVRPATNARLAAILDLPQTRLLPWPVLDPPSLEPVLAEALIARSLGDNPDLRRLAERIERNESARELAGLQRWPDVTVGVDYFETGSPLAPTPSGGEDPVALRVMFNLPFWGSRYAAAEREADFELEASTASLADRRAGIASEIEHAAFRLDDARRQVVLYRDTLLPRARESLEVTRAAYRTDAAALIDLIDIERTLLEFTTGYWRACRDHHQSNARLRAIVGGDL